MLTAIRCFVQFCNPKKSNDLFLTCKCIYITHNIKIHNALISSKTPRKTCLKKNCQILVFKILKKKRRLAPMCFKHLGLVPESRYNFSEKVSVFAIYLQYIAYSSSHNKMFPSLENTETIIFMGQLNNSRIGVAMAVFLWSFEGLKLPGFTDFIVKLAKIECYLW